MDWHPRGGTNFTQISVALQNAASKSRMIRDRCKTS
jgi:hypothetical protein